MKILSKLSVLILFFVFVSTFNAMADRDVAISFKELPVIAQEIIQANFPKAKVALSKKEVDLFSKSYDVIFTNGDKIEFDGEGQWEKISCKYSQVPSALIPSVILQYIKHNFADSPIVKIEREKRGYEVELKKGLELEFDKKGQCLDIDD